MFSQNGWLGSGTVIPLCRTVGDSEAILKSRFYDFFRSREANRLGIAAIEKMLGYPRRQRERGETTGKTFHRGFLGKEQGRTGKGA